MNLTEEQISEYNKEIGIFMGAELSSNVHGEILILKDCPREEHNSIEYWYACYPDSCNPLEYDSNWNWLIPAYQKLCKSIPFNFCQIHGDKVWSSGLIQLPFQQALFFVTGDMCTRYNNKELHLNY